MVHVLRHHYALREAYVI